MSIGILGAHRVGKTTLAMEYAYRYEIPFLQTNTSDVFKKHGIDPKEQMSFKARLYIQRCILEEADKQWTNALEYFITDRTPVDYVMYTLADCVLDVGASDYKELQIYMNDCFEVCYTHFTVLVLLQPGIEIKEDDKKTTASLNPAYIEHLNALAWGLCNNEKLRVPKFYIPRARTDIGERIASVKYCYDKVFSKKAESRFTLH